jgi:hypothetical protein
MRINRNEQEKKLIEQHPVRDQRAASVQGHVTTYAIARA